MGKAPYKLNSGFNSQTSIDKYLMQKLINRAKVVLLTHNADFRKEDEHMYIFTCR